MSNIFNTSTLEYYNYGENNFMEPAFGPAYKVKVSDKDGNIITLEKDGSLYAMVSLNLSGNVLSLIDKAHNDSVLAEVDFPNAGYIDNCHFDEETNSIVFDIVTLNGEIETVELDVASLVELYEAGQGIEIGEKNEETGRKPISIKLVDGEELLKLSDDGLGLDQKVVTDEELEEAVSGKADTEYVDTLYETVSGFVSGITEIEEEIDKIKEILGTEETNPSISDQLDEIRSGMTDIDEEIGEFSGIVDTIKDDVDGLKEDVEDLKEKVDEISGNVETITSDVDSLSGAVEALEEEVTKISDDVESLSGNLDTLRNDLENEIEERESTAVADAEYDSSAKTINFYNINGELVDSIDATEFIKDGMVDNVEIKDVDGVTCLAIVFNVDAGKEEIDIPLTQIFNPDNYYTKDEIDSKIEGLEGEIASEAEARQANDSWLNDKINTEIANREAGDTALQDAIDALGSELRDDLAEETQARIDGDAAVEASIDEKVEAEKERAEAAEQAIADSIAGFDDRIHDVEEGLRDLGTTVGDLGNRISGFEASLADETAARMDRDQELADAIADIRDAYATIEYVDTKDAEVKEEAITTSINSAKTYTDDEVDAAKAELKQYCDDGHQELLDAISENTTRINGITNTSNNGVLDVLHDEFHELIDGVTEQALPGLIADMLRRIEALEQRQ